jgi:hypothetical protein
VLEYHDPPALAQEHERFGLVIQIDFVLADETDQLQRIRAGVSDESHQVFARQR